ncbi:MAG: hypothetical protein NTV86_07565 [Planctomycetota bacterium]|nr:hypothetical protein [Planctomycetota bacterium]
MESIFHTAVIQGRHGSTSREAIEFERASQLRAIQLLRRKVRMSEAPSVAPQDGRPGTSTRV